jgi:hypothetical protein
LSGVQSESGSSALMLGEMYQASLVWAWAMPQTESVASATRESRRNGLFFMELLLM